MRTNIEIDDDLMEGAMRAGHFKTKKDAVEAGLKLLSRQAAYREILKWEGKLQWDEDDEPAALSGGVVRTGGNATVLVANEPAAKSLVKPTAAKVRHGRR
ncbi:MAG: type II toxin-antitoxin system VapB family antitoxin [Burkholderiaceae bacterium]|nr:type II toxin-antitoxin system VapB family antitoxin [Burkholderiaceae bacterium]